MKLTVIGHWGAFPKANGASSGYLLQAGEKNILLDCGSGVLSRVQTHLDLCDLDGVVLSHFHADHIADIYCLQHAMMILNKLGRRQVSLPIYGWQQDEDYASLNYQSFTEAKPIGPNIQLQIGEISFTFAQNVHPRLSLAMRIEYGGKVIVYSGDTGWSEDLIGLAQGADLFLCESSIYPENKLSGHLTASEAARIATKAGVQKLVLTHLPTYGDQQRMLEDGFREFSGSIALAEQDKMWEI